MTFNLTLAQYHYKAVTDKKNHPFHVGQRWNFIPDNKHQVEHILKYHGASSVSDFQNKIDAEIERRGSLPGYKKGDELSETMFIYEMYIGQYTTLGFRSFTSSYINEIHPIVGYDTLRKKFEEDILIEGWRWNWMKFTFDSRAEVVKIKTWSDVHGSDDCLFETEIPMLEKQKKFYIENILIPGSKRAAEREYAIIQEKKRNEEIEALRLDGYNYIRRTL
jgi:hypothetical protein